MAGPVAPKPAARAPLSAALLAPQIQAPAIPSIGALGIPDMAGAPMIAGAPTDGSAPTIQPLDLPGFGGQPAAPQQPGNLMEAAGLGNLNAQASSVAPDTNPSDPLSWVLDMLDRPRRAVMDTASAIGNSAQDTILGAQGKEAAPNPLNELGNVVSAPFRGLFSTNAADQQTGSQILNESLRKQEEILLPKGAKQVDPSKVPGMSVAEGIGGFALDVLADPLTYVGGPVIKGALMGGRALLTGARALKDVAPEAVAVAKVADKAAGGDPKAANLIEQMAATGADDSARAAADVAKPAEVPGVPQPSTPSAVADAATGTNAPPTPVPTPVIGPKWTPKLELNLKDFNRQIDELQLVDSSRMSLKEKAVFSAKLDRLTTARDKLIARKYPTGAPAAGAAETPTPAAAAPAVPADTTTDLGRALATSKPQVGSTFRELAEKAIGRPLTDEEAAFADPLHKWMKKDTTNRDPQAMQALSNFIAQFPVHDTPLYRGIKESIPLPEGMKPWPGKLETQAKWDQVAAAKPGDVIDLGGPSSWSTDPQIGRQFAKGGVVFRFEGPKRSANLRVFGSGDEREHLVDGALKVVKVTAEDDGTRVIDVERAATPEAAAAPREPVPSVDKPVEKPISAELAEPKSVGDQLRASKIAPNFVKAYDKMSAAVAAGAPNMLDAYQNALKSKTMRTLFGDSFMASVKNYTNPERFARMLDETYRIVKEGGHLDDGELETTLSGARNMVRGLLSDAGVAVDKTQAERAAFKARSTVAQTANPVAVMQKMRSAAPRMPEMVRGIQPKDLQDLVKSRSDALRDPDPGQDIRTETGAWTDGKGVGQSSAKYTDRMNTHNQAYDVIRSSQVGAKQMVANLETRGGAMRSEVLRGIVMGQPGRVGLLDGLTRVRDTWGYGHYLEDGIHTPVPMSAHQAISLLGSGSAADQRIVDKLLFNGGTPASKTNILEAIAAAIHGESADAIRAILSKDTKRARFGTQGNFLAKGKATGNVDHVLVKPGTRLPKGYTKVPNPDHPGMFYIRQSADSLLDEATDLIMRRSDDLRALGKDNAEAYARRTGTEALELTDAAQKATDLARATPSMIAEALQGLAEPEKLVQSVADVAGGARQDSKALAVELVKATTPESVAIDAKAKVASAAKVKKGDLKGARAEAQKGSDAAAKETQETYEQQAAVATKEADAADAAAGNTADVGATAEAAAAEEPAYLGPEWDVDQRIGLGRINRTAKEFDPNATDARIQGRFARTMQGVFSFVNKGANATARNFGLEELHTGRLGVTRRLAREYGMLGHDFAPYTQQMIGNRSVGAIVLDDALRRRPSAPEFQRARGIVDQMVSHFMGAGVDGQGKMLAEPFLRSGVEREHIFNLLKEKGIIPQDRVWDDTLDDMLVGSHPQTGSFVGSIADWLVKGDPASNIAPIKILDPNEFLQRMFTATNEFSMHVGIAQDLRALGLSHGFLSAKPGGSLVRIVGKKGSLFSHVLGDVWADHETAVAVNRVADMLKPTAQMKSELSTILQAFDDLQQAWKYGETAIRPGTHLHNYLSDHIMTWLAEGGRGYKRAMVAATKMLAANEKGGAMSVAEMMNGIMGLTHDPDSYKGLDEVLFKGKHGQLTNHEANQLISDSGLTASARNIQRTDSENLSQVGKRMEQFYQSWAGKKIDKLNELQENHVRMTHAALTLQKALDTGFVETRWGKRVSILSKDGSVNHNALKLALGERVRRFHPDPNMLTQFEKDGIRRAMPFYMWNRGAVPAILEAAYLHPGRVLSFNKLSFNVGTALGVQGNNLADPYPDGAWPGFLLNQMQGPQASIGGQLFTANPGIPTWDVANMFTDPNQITGSISPLLSIPVEMATGKGWETHEPINNWYDAIDSNLPGVATIASMTGYSPTNSLVSMLGGNGPQKTSLAAQGQQDPLQPVVSGLGYVGGVNTTHVNKTSYEMAGVAQQQQRLLDIMTGKSPQFGH